MGEYNDEKLRMMEDEMNRFEAEIGIPVPPLLARPVIGVNTYNQVQRRLEEQQMPEYHPGMFAPPMIPILQNVPNVQGIPGFVGIPPPPPPPPPLLIPHQVQQRNMQPIRGAMIPPPISFREMAPNLPPPRPPQPQFVSGPIAPPPPPATTTGTAVVSMAPMLYNPATKAPPRIHHARPKPTQSADDTYATFQNELSQLSEPKPSKKSRMADKFESLRAKDMADKVKASIVATVTPIATQPAAVEEQPVTATGRKKKNKKLVRMAGGQIWEDNSLTEWEDDDYRIFCGDLGNDVTDEILTRTFSKYTSFLKAKVVRDKRSNKTKGFGFVSFKDPQDFIKAMKEMNGRYVGSRPIKLRKSTWKSRNLDNVRKKEKEKTALIGLLTGR